MSKDILLKKFVSWLLGKKSQGELDINSRTWRSQIAWCWEIIPDQPKLKDSYSVIVIDGIRVSSQVCLIAKTTERVIGWHWVSWESSTTWECLLGRIPCPSVVVCDGQKGMTLAIARNWPNTHIQRCIFHVWQNIRIRLTLNPKTEAGKDLLHLVRDIWEVKDIKAVKKWISSLDDWKAKYEPYLKERTYANPDNLQQNKYRRKWWYTHKNLRSSYRQLKSLSENQQLFTYIYTSTDIPIPRTTNHVEGGVNSQIRTLLKHHRGLSQTHQQRLVDWYLSSRSDC